MTELSFARSFLQTLDTKPTKLSPTHLEDPKTYPARSAYILPKLPNPLPKRQKLAPGAERSLTVSLKSLRNPPLDIVLHTQPPSTSILQLKEAISSQTSIPVPKIRLLFAKKPVPDSKVLKDLAGEGHGRGEKLEFSVLIIGGAGAVRKGEEDVGGVGETRMGRGGDVVRTEAFWGDLRGFLVQRLKDEREGEKVFGVFKRAWEAQK